MTPHFIAMSFSGKRLAVEIGDLDIAEEVHLHDEVIVADQRVDLGQRKHLLVHLRAVDAAALFAR